MEMIIKMGKKVFLNTKFLGKVQAPLRNRAQIVKNLFDKRFRVCHPVLRHRVWMTRASTEWPNYPSLWTWFRVSHFKAVLTCRFRIKYGMTGASTEWQTIRHPELVSESPALNTVLTCRFRVCHPVLRHRVWMTGESTKWQTIRHPELDSESPAFKYSFDL